MGADPNPSPGRGTAAHRAGARLDSLTGLRGVAALVVFGVHIGPLVSGLPARVLPWYEVGGRSAVTFFFVLSGFVLTWTARPGDTARGFWRRRFARVYPAYAVSLLLAADLGTDLVNGTLDPVTGAGAFLLVQAWVPDPAWYFAVNGVAWSLSCEAFFYLVFPAFIRPLLRLGRPGRRRLQALLLLTVLTVTVADHLLGGSGWLVRFCPAVRLLDFVLGATVAVDVARREMPLAGIRLGPALGLSAFALAVSAVPPLQFLSVSALPLVPFLLVLGAAARRDLAAVPGQRRGLLAGPVGVRAGALSYCFYLTHQLAVRAVVRFVPGATTTPLGGLPAVALALGCAFAFAVVVHVGVERPLERRIRGRDPHPAPVTVSA